MALRDRLLGNPDRLGGPELARGIRRGGEAFVVRCVRALGERDEEPAVDVLLPLLADQRAGVRRAAATALGNLGRPRAEALLTDAWREERSEEGKLALAVARVRCGADPGSVGEALDRFERRTLHTFTGPRSPQRGVGVSTVFDRFWPALGDVPGEVRPRAVLLAERRALVDHESAGREGRADVQALAALRHPDDHLRFEHLFRSAGRREEHTLHIALGMSGDPRALPLLERALFATDVDPGRGFAQRRLCATAIGRLGLRAATPLLLRALENEALDFEGRPGAGMGVQYPVRTNLLWALGEIADPASIPVILPYLADTHGSALGGFYLAAMDALTKFGAAARPALLSTLRGGAEVPAANALGVLAALGDDVSPHTHDPRPAVASVATRALAAR